MSKYIKLDDAIALSEKFHLFGRTGVVVSVGDLKALPTEDVRPERYATWVPVDENKMIWECSGCGCMWELNDGGTPHDNDMNYCPECGALIVRSLI